MTPAQIIALVRDALIVAGVAWLIFHIYREGEDRVRRQDLEAVQKQLEANSKQAADWKQEVIDAQAHQREVMEGVADAIHRQRTPIIVQSPAHAGRPNSVSCSATPSASSTAGSGPVISGVGNDSGSYNARDAINQFELKYESALADCRAVLQAWPTNK